MTQVNRCVKLSLIVSNIFFAIVGGAIIALALLLQLLTRLNGASLEGRGSALILLYVVGTITMVVAAVGAYGAHRQSRVALIVFLVCMVIGTLMMLRVGIPLAAVRPEVEGLMSRRFGELLPLDEADEKTKEIADGVQEMMQCCGVFSYDDWRQNIPDSCLCDEAARLEGKCQVVNYNLMMLQMRKSVFRQPCFPLIVHYVLLAFDIVMGIAFVLALLALLGLTLSSILIHQLRAGRRPAVMLVPAIFKPAPPKYQELQNAPVY
ncbi:tetraspanin-8-like isoform X2 [Hippocampus comes]|uniref:tetraspanin-8-like isoform X2 n=1 Tax=Hippocampus comes TaxID=109280 RepID=UPI00094EA81E|nr:PREDICTED: tetraspanin-8-like isoform X2 [Hippocampus comes]